jgi:hypothetical protein
MSVHNGSCLQLQTRKAQTSSFQSLTVCLAFSNKLPATGCITKAQRVTKPERERKILLHRKNKMYSLVDKH